MEITYQTENGCLLLNLYAADTPPLGQYGHIRLGYLREYCEGINTSLQLSDKLEADLQEPR